MRLNIQPQFLSGTAANLLNGAFASLSGPVGFTPTQPRIHVTSASFTSNGGDSNSVALFKGASGASAAGTEVLSASVETGANTVTVPLDIVLDAADFLVGVCPQGSSRVVVSLEAYIDF